MAYNYKQSKSELETMPTLGDIINHEEEWVKAHAPTDRAARLNLFMYKVIQPNEVGTNLPAVRGGLVPFTEMQTVPAVQFNDHAHDQLLARLDIPQRLWDRWDVATKTVVVNKMFQLDQKLEKDVLIRIVDNNTVRALMSSRFEPYDTLELLRTVAPFCPDAKVRIAYNDDLTTNICVTFPNTATELKVGDVAEQGLRIRNSEVGMASVTLCGYVFRLRCLNGATSGGDGGSYHFRHIGDGDSLRERVQSAVESAVLEARKVTEQFKNAMNVAIDDPITRIQQIVTDNKMSKDEFNAMLNAYTLEPDRSLFGVVNAITRTAKDLDGEKAYEYETLATKLLSVGK